MACSWTVILLSGVLAELPDCPGTAGCGGLSAAVGANGQAGQPEDSSGRTGIESQQLMTDRRTILQLQSLERRLAQAGLPELREQLLLLRQAQPQWMMPGPDDTWEPLYRRVFRLFHQLTREQQQLLRSEDEALAEAELQLLLRQPQSMAGLLPLIHRFPGTAASYQAHLILAKQHLDRGGRLAAQLWLRPLTEPGVPEPWRSRAEGWLQRLASEQPAEQAVPAAAGAAVPATTSASALPQTVPVPTVPPQRTRGQSVRVPAAQVSAQPKQPALDGAAQDGVLQGGAAPPESEDYAGLPQYVHWSYTPHMPTAVAELADRFIRSAQQSRAIPWTTWSPLVDEQQVYVRTLRGVVALDCRSGQATWQWSTAENLAEKLLQRCLNMDDAQLSAGALAEIVFHVLNRSPLADLLHRNAVVGRLTGDAQRVYLVDDSAGLSVPDNRRRFIPPGSSELTETPQSCLVALDKRTGRRLWSAGGEPVEERFGNELSQAWIAGAPTVAGGSLYCVMEQKDVLQLACLSAESGQLDWKLVLTFPPTPAGRDVFRRQTSAMPTVEQGLLWTSTTTGWLMGIDPLTRSLLWAHRTGSATELEDGPVDHRRSTPMTSQRSLERSWLDRPPVLVGTQLIVFPTHAQELLILDAFTGQLEQRLPTGSHVLPLHVDDQRIVLAGPESMEALSVRDGSSLWKRPFAQGDRRPAGNAVARDGRLLVLLSDGAVVAVSLQDGQLQGSRPGLRDTPVWGGLYAAGDELLACSPRQVTLLSRVPSESEVISPLARAELELAAGRLAEARALLAAAASASVEAERFRQLQFRILAASAVADPEQSSELLLQLVHLARLPAERAELLQLQVLQLSHDGRLAEAGRLLLQALVQDDDTLAQAVPPRQWRLPAESLPAAPLSAEHVSAESGLSEVPPELGRVHCSLRTWLLGHLQQLCAHRDLLDQLLEDIRRLPDELAVQLPVVELAPELQRRVAERLSRGDVGELTLHLILQQWELQRNQPAAVASEQPRPGELPADLRAALEQLSRQVQESRQVAGAAPTAWQELRQRLLQVLQAELQAGNGPQQNAVAAPGAQQPAAEASPGSLAANTAAELQSLWELWPSVPYRVVPVTQSVTLSQTDQPLKLRELDDGFLSAYEWQIQREAMLLKVRDGRQPAAQAWTVPAMFPNYAVLARVTASVIRRGSVVVAQTGQSLRALSVLDQRLLWQRNYPETSDGVAEWGGSVDRLFTSYAVDHRPALLPLTWSEHQICGATTRWICMQTPARLEMLDSLTGQPLWSLDGHLGGVQAFATSDVVLLYHPDQQQVCALRARDGRPVRTWLTPADLECAVLAVGDLLVLLRCSETPQRSVTVEWVHPLNRGSVRSVSAQAVEHLQFLDQQTLVAFRPPGFDVIHLATAAVEHHEGLLTSAPATPPANAVPPADDALFAPAAPTAGRAPPAGRWMLNADPINYYAWVRAAPDQNSLNRVPGHELAPIEGDLLAIHRQSGRLQWRLPANAVAGATFDQPLSPVLLLFQPDLNERGLQLRGGQPSVTNLRGVLKTNGMVIFEHRQNSRFPVPFVRLLTGAQHHFDIEAFGSRIRLLPQLTTESAQPLLPVKSSAGPEPQPSAQPAVPPESRPPLPAPSPTDPAPVPQ